MGSFLKADLPPAYTPRFGMVWHAKSKASWLIWVTYQGWHLAYPPPAESQGVLVDVMPQVLLRWEALACLRLQGINHSPALMGHVDECSSGSTTLEKDIGFVGVHHVGILCKDLDKSLKFYCGVLGMKVCDLRPDKTLPFRGAWLWVGDQMIHLMELPNPDPVQGRPLHGGRDRHMCLHVKNLDGLKCALKNAGAFFTESESLKPQVFARDPDGNCLEFQPLDVGPSTGS
ncbi:hypothetical protein GOP47_0022905 [Adiantum capillus-veneris]|uniref:VOC domain-containing protein n=1 Tax=Adiantum capillus-veneris TaxID=13818 RepID=A0A9D4Z7B5_ADICA|nr:hypothetical protein GOP47_0022905 [Adiantum capillus-veneris]